MKYFFDIEGTLSFKPIGSGKEGKMTLSDLLFGKNFLNMLPNKPLVEFAKQLKSEDIFIISTTDTNNEIEQKYIWISKYLPNVKRNNILFVSSEYSKGSVIEQVLLSKHYVGTDVVFVDDKQTNLNSAKYLNISCLTPEQFYLKYQNKRCT